jgi:glycosyltransferase involved in cell wall biosynthesis
MRIALVVQRYGDEVVGGAELHARWIAQRLARRHQVEVLSTCAIDYLTWANEYDPGPAQVGGLSVLRFPVERQRTADGFDALSSRVHFQAHSDAEERRWMDEHGPVTPGLVAHLRAQRQRYDAVIFFSYRYWTTHHGLRELPERAILVPTAEADPTIRLRIFRDFFRLPAAYAFNTPEERDLIVQACGLSELPGEVVGVGIEDAPVFPPDEIRRRLDVLGDYAVYVGRIEAAKGCSRLFEHFTRLVAERAPHLNLVLVGRAVLPVPTHVNVAHLGVLSETDKLSVIGAARLLVHPSPYESLSMALLEAWKMSRPALVNGRCDVLRGQVLRSGGGLYYASYDEFAEALSWLLANRESAERMGRSGRAYFEAEYDWDVVMEKYERLLARVSARAGAR